MAQTELKIAAVSDLHGQLPTIPPCDLLLIAGDVAPDRFYDAWARHAPSLQAGWVRSTYEYWANHQPCAHVAGTWGNHDFCGQRGFTAPSMYVDRLVEVLGLRIWLTPWSRTFMDWAFMKSEDELRDIYARIPEGIDILSKSRGYAAFTITPSFKSCCWLAASAPASSGACPRRSYERHLRRDRQNE